MIRSCGRPPAPPRRGEAFDGDGAPQPDDRRVCPDRRLHSRDGGPVARTASCSSPGRSVSIPDGAPGATLDDQLELIWANLRTILASAGMTVDNIVRLTSYLRSGSTPQRTRAPGRRPWAVGSSRRRRSSSTCWLAPGWSRSRRSPRREPSGERSNSDEVERAAERPRRPNSDISFREDVVEGVREVVAGHPLPDPGVVEPALVAEARGRGRARTHGRCMSHRRPVPSAGPRRPNRGTRTHPRRPARSSAGRPRPGTGAGRSR